MELTLFWDQAALAGRDDPAQPVTAWVKDASGEVWAVVEAAVTGAEDTVTGWSGPVSAQALTLRLPLGLRSGSYHSGSRSLRRPKRQPGRNHGRRRRASVTSRQTPTRPAHSILIESDVRFGDELTLVGYEVEPAGEEVVVDLLWAVERTPTIPYKIFLHLVDTADQILAQQDSCLGGVAPDATCATMDGWSAGDVIRQRLHLPLAQGEGPFYVGLYHPEQESASRSRSAARSRPMDATGCPASMQKALPEIYPPRELTSSTRRHRITRFSPRCGRWPAAVLATTPKPRRGSPASYPAQPPPAKAPTAPGYAPR